MYWIQTFGETEIFSDFFSQSQILLATWTTTTPWKSQAIKDQDQQATRQWIQLFDRMETIF